MIDVPGSLAPRLRRAVTLALPVLLIGCAGPRDAPPALLQSAARQTRAGQEVYLHGNAAAAVPALGEAVRLHLAAGDLPGATLALVNLALAQRAAGDAPGAASSAARLRDLAPAARQQARERAGKDETPAAEIAAASAWLAALLALDRGDAPTAAVLLAGVRPKLPARSPWPGRTETLRAEIALANGDVPGAIACARIGQVASAAARDHTEEARAWRLAGAAHLRLGHWKEARVAFLAAVKIEETLGSGDRMAGDLSQLAAISEKLGDPGAAQLYTERARAIVAAR